MKKLIVCLFILCLTVSTLTAGPKHKELWKGPARIDTSADDYFLKKHKSDIGLTKDGHFFVKKSYLDEWGQYQAKQQYAIIIQNNNWYDPRVIQINFAGNVAGLVVIEPAWYEKIWKDYKEAMFPRHNDTLGNILGWFFTVVIVIVIGLTFWGIIYGISYAANNWFVATKEGDARIIAKDYNEQETTLGTIPIFSTNGTSIAVIPMTSPEVCQVLVEVPTENKVAWMNVRKKFYNAVKVEDRGRVSYTIGRFNRKMHVHSITIN